MKMFIAIFLLMTVAFTGCSKKEPVQKKVSQGKEVDVSRQHLVQGTVLLKQGDVVKAVEQFATSIRIAPDQFDGYLMLCETFLNLKQYAQAASVMTSAVRQFPNNGLAYYLLALAHEGAGQKLPAIVAARRSVELFQAAKDTEGQKRSTMLLTILVQSAKQEAAKQAEDNAVTEAKKAVDARAAQVDALAQ